MNDFLLLGAKTYFCAVSGLCDGASPTELDRRFPRPRTRPRSRQLGFQFEAGSQRGFLIADPAEAEEVQRVRERPGQVWREYAEGRTYPAITVTDKTPVLLIDVVEHACPGTKAWALSPLWWIFEKKVRTYEGLVEVIGRMPATYKNRLLMSWSGGDQLPTLILPTEEDVCFFAKRGGPWGLGSLACTVQIAHLVGDSPLQHFSALALLSTTYEWRQHYALGENFMPVWASLRKGLNNLTYRGFEGTELKAPLNGRLIWRQLKKLQARR